MEGCLKIKIFSLWRMFHRVPVQNGKKYGAVKFFHSSKKASVCLLRVVANVGVAGILQTNGSFAALKNSAGFFSES